MQKISKSHFALSNYAEQSKLKELTRVLNEESITTWSLNGSNVIDQKTLFQQIQQGLPWSAGRSEIHGWDAFKDSLWEMVTQQEGKEFALIWNDTQAMLDGGLQDFVTASHILTELGRQLYNPNSNDQPRKIFYLFFLGEGANFQTT